MHSFLVKERLCFYQNTLNLPIPTHTYTLDICIILCILVDANSEVGVLIACRKWPEIINDTPFIGNHGVLLRNFGYQN